MNTLKKLRLSIWKKVVEKYYTGRATTYDVSDVTFPPSREFISYLTQSFTESTIERFENGPTFSSYHVSYAKGDEHGELIYKTTKAIYPSFNGFNTLEEYQRSFSAGER